MESLIEVALVAGVASALSLWALRSHSYVGSLLGIAVGSLGALPGAAAVGLIVSYLHAVLAKGTLDGTLWVRLGGLALAFILPVVGLPLSILLPLFLLVTGTNLLYVGGFAAVSILMSSWGAPQWVMVMMLAMSIWTRNYGESSLELISQENTAAAASTEADPYANAQLGSRSKSNIVYGVGFFLLPLMGVAVSHSTLAQRIGIHATALILIETLMEGYCLKAALISSPYPMARTGLAEFLQNAAMSLPENTGMTLASVAIGVSLSLLLTRVFGIAAPAPKLEKLISLAALGVLCSGSPQLFVIAVVGSYLLSQIGGDKSGGWSSLPFQQAQ